ncbi:heme-binding protein, partial [Vibrio cholerae]|nr:heme-binding protein [Vibrio cholerae]EJR3663997.1 heme-binding protein [Vibrio cholerae]EKF9193528.1 heme-binding protein [Vibrio cholerae]
MISLNLAKQITAIAIQQAKQQEFNICVSVVDQAGLLVHFERMDNALLGAIDVAIKKARTA